MPRRFRVVERIIPVANNDNSVHASARAEAVAALKVLRFYKLPEVDITLDQGLILHGMVKLCIGEINNAGTLEEKWEAMHVDMPWQRWLACRHEDARKRVKHTRIYEKYLAVCERVAEEMQ
jgi:hypothetical protein